MSKAVAQPKVEINGEILSSHAFNQYVAIFFPSAEQTHRMSTHFH